MFSPIRGLSHHFKMFGTIGALSLALLVPATAAMAAPQTATTPQKCAATDVQCVITFGDQRITERQQALTALQNKITTSQQKKDVNDVQADNVLADLQTRQNELTTLKTKLDAETQAKAARQDISNLYTTLRIYAVVLPRDYRWLHLAIEIDLRDVFQDHEANIETAIDKATNNKDQLNSLFGDYKTVISGTEGLIDQAKAALPQLTVDNYNNNRTAYNAALNQLTTSENSLQANLKQVASDHHQIAQLLK
jgi:chromosome segregation ATPase